VTFRSARTRPSCRDGGRTGTRGAAPFVVPCPPLGA